MKIELIENGPWYHGSNVMFNTHRTGSTITQWRELAEAFSHKPSKLSFDDGVITHNGTESGFLYVIVEPITVGEDVFQHPHTTMGANTEFLTKRPPQNVHLELNC